MCSGGVAAGRYQSHAFGHDARRRGNGEGSITRHKKSGLYMARYTVETPTGSKRRTIYAETRKEAADKLAKALSDRADGIVVDDKNLTVGEYLDRWVSDCVRGTVRESTYDRDKYLASNHIKPSIGRVKLKNLNPLHLQSLYRERLDSGLSGSTVQKIHHVLHKGLEQAARWSLIPRNRADDVNAPTATTKEMHPLSAHEARKLLEAARGDRLEALYVLAVHTGMRQGELLGLKWADLDLENSRVSVRRTLTRADGGKRYTLGDPKTKKSRRTVRLTPQAVEVLRHHLTSQMEEIVRLGDIYDDQGLVFTSEPGTPINPSNLRQRSFRPLLKRAGLPQITFHDLRHTCASLLFQKNVHPKFVQELLGHASVAITLDTYSHALPGMGGEAADAIEELLR
jgi:integrase